jgi:hypothetical protein
MSVIQPFNQSVVAGEIISFSDPMANNKSAGAKKHSGVFELRGSKNRAPKIPRSECQM